KTTLLNHILKNDKGYKIAVIVNDIGEVNIDADLIEDGGVVNSKDDSLVPLQNGCICCTLKHSLIDQICELVGKQKFDHIVIEASGICEPVPIAQTIVAIGDMCKQNHMPEICHLDAVVSVVDANRLAKEFDCGEAIVKDNLDDEDLENLVFQQLE
ncbi:MAG TPA: cobalamin biosynthesis protein CobW, partial [Clostridiales bacterium]|nr:cobalamin biosynthesis protein CobW [Clostridiales bacterium]